MKKSFLGFGFFFHFNSYFFLIILPATSAPFQNKAGESKLWDLKRLGLTFYCNSHLSQENSSETSVIGE